MSQPLDGRLFGPRNHCFGCSPDHPIGLHLTFDRDGDDVVTRFVPSERHQGAPGIMHGGLVATVADELAAWVIVALLGKFGFTASFSSRLLRPVRIGTELVGRGRLVRDRRRIVDVAVELSQAGEPAYSGEFRFALLDQAASERLLGAPLPEDWTRFVRT
ncbi:MAG: PaaI family thioesterase [Deltaproteobacteria bacterium]|nr:PaaI family thioesterase [Deltaproteobacteria bacterium]